MKLHDNRSYFVFPGYGTAFRNMAALLARWGLGDRHGGFWPGFHGGGVLTVPDGLEAETLSGLTESGIAPSQAGVRDGSGERSWRGIS